MGRAPLTESNTQPELAIDQRLQPEHVFGIVALGITIRFVFLLLAWNQTAFADESQYLYLAAVWSRFGVYTDSTMYLWPPGYPCFLYGCLKLFGPAGVYAAKLIQVVLSGAIGLSTILIAYRLATARAACLAGLMWAVYLPLIGFTHSLWPETLYLALLMPGFCLLLPFFGQEAGKGGRKNERSNARLVAAGVLIGLSILVKEVALWWFVLVGMLLLFQRRQRSWSVALNRASLFLLAGAVVILPWALRCYEVYGRIVPSGATLGRNVHLGINSKYWNVDYPLPDSARITEANADVHRLLTETAAQQWQTSTARNVVALSSDNVRRGLRFAADNPGYFARSRIKNLADWATPLSFFVRNFALARYDGILRNPVAWRVLVVAAMLMPMTVLAASAGGYFHALRGVAGRGFLGVTLLYFIAANVLIVASSRYRLCIAPLLIVLAATFLAGGFRRRWTKRGIAACTVVWGTLVILWLINALEIREMIRVIQERCTA